MLNFRALTIAAALVLAPCVHPSAQVAAEACTVAVGVSESGGTVTAEGSTICAPVNIGSPSTTVTLFVNGSPVGTSTGNPGKVTTPCVVGNSYYATAHSIYGTKTSTTLTPASCS
jgi:hypothetical protein